MKASQRNCEHKLCPKNQRGIKRDKDVWCEMWVGLLMQGYTKCYYQIIECIWKSQDAPENCGSFADTMLGK